MKKFALISLLFFFSLSLYSQKKPLDHTVYDGWQNIGEKILSPNGKFIAYTINPQEGDGTLIVQNSDGTYKKSIPRGYNALITEDNLFLVFKIKPLFKETRDAKIKKKKPEDLPKDSLGILELGKDSIIKKPGIKSFKTPEKGSGWLAYQYEKGYPKTISKAINPDSLSRIKHISFMADSLVHLADSLRKKVAEAKIKGLKILQPSKKENKKPLDEPLEEGSVLVLRNLSNGEEKEFNLVTDYLFSNNGKKLVLSTSRKNSKPFSKNYVGLVSLPELKVDTVLRNFTDVKSFAFDEEGNQLAFVADRDSSAKALQKFYKLYYYRSGMDSAQLKADKNTEAIGKGFTISENYSLHFSKQAKRLYLGFSPIRPLKDTKTPEFEKAGVDIWNYKDDELQPVQLKNLEKDLKKSYLAVLDLDKSTILPLGDEKFPEITITQEGDGNTFYSGSDFGKRVEKQWQGYSLIDLYAIDAFSGLKKLIKKDYRGEYFPSYSGKYVLLYDIKQKTYSVYNSQTQNLYPVAKDLKSPVYNEENDVPDDPEPYGIAQWTEGDRYILIYDRYDVWKVDPEGKDNSIDLTHGRSSKTQYRYIKTDREEKFIKENQPIWFETFNEFTKDYGFQAFDLKNLEPIGYYKNLQKGFRLSQFLKAKNAPYYLYLKENYQKSPNLYLDKIVFNQTLDYLPSINNTEVPQSNINTQQSQYIWGTAELFKWKAYTGKETEGIVYKPENFDASKKYPMIVYYYERNNNTLNYYQAPSPTPSRLNIPFFVSRGYIVFVPDIWYINGHPGKSAYDYIMSGTRALIKQGYIDSTKLGLQGQSWGGYQTAYLITQTNLFAAAWAGAPVVNMFSAYGGIRWESGVNRQMQYEKTQSRIGTTIWDRPDLYIENSPLFHLQKVKTPLVIMSNDADGAVPWYQGIEFFTAMRRLHKPIWLLQYNGEAHNLVERRNRKDIQIREQQFFDWLLKGEKPPVWISKGVPATLKGIDYGLKLE